MSEPIEPSQEATVNIVPSKGNLVNPQILVVGLAPGVLEDEQGECFVGPAGKILDEVIAEARVDRSILNLTNIVRSIAWKDKANKQYRDPTDEEIAAAAPTLINEIAQYKPRVIVALGAVVTNYFRPNTDGARISALRGKPVAWKHPQTGEEFTVLPTFHPSAVVRAQRLYRKHLLNDLLFANQMACNPNVFEGTNYEYLDTEAKIEAAVNRMLRLAEADPEFVASVDTETAWGPGVPEDYPRSKKAISLNPFDPFNILVAVQISFAPKQGYLIPIFHNDSPFKDYASLCMVRYHLQRLFDKVKVIGQNFKFDYRVLKVKLGVDVKHFWFDSMIAHFLRYGKEDARSLESFAARYCNMAGYKSEMAKALEMLPEERRHMGYVPLDKLIRYGCGDCDAVIRYYYILRPELEEMGFWDVYREILQPATVSLAKIEINGMHIDPARLEKLHDEFPKELDQLLLKIRDYRWIKAFELTAEKESMFEFKPSSSQHLSRLFFTSMGLSQRGLKRTAGGNTQTGKKTRATLAANALKIGKKDIHDLIKDIDLWKVKQKLYTAYVKNARSLIYDTNEFPHVMNDFKPSYMVPWCFHSNVKIDSTETGRLSVELPNFQQVPFKSLIKWMFTSRYYNEGGFLLQGDYSQAELRVIAMLAGETNMLEAFARGEDIHMYVASMIFGAKGVPKNRITKQMRKIAKTASFGIIYGQGPAALAANFGTSIEEAEEIICTLYKVFPNLRAWMDAKIKEAKDYGFVVSPMGRVRYLPDVNFVDDEDPKNEMMVRAAAERRAVNTPIQSAASDWNLCALNEIVTRTEGMKSLPVATIHDAIMFDVFPSEFFKVLSIMQHEMVTRLPQRFDWITVLPKADFELGMDWQSMVDFEVEADGMWKVKGYPHHIQMNLDHLRQKAGMVFDLVQPVVVGEKEEDSWAKILFTQIEPSLVTASKTGN